MAPLEIVGMAGDVGRAIDRGFQKELLGIVVTLKKAGEPQVSYALDANGSLVSVSRWKNGAMGEPIHAQEFLKQIDARQGLQSAVQQIQELAKPLLEQ